MSLKVHYMNACEYLFGKNKSITLKYKNTKNGLNFLIYRNALKELNNKVKDGGKKKLSKTVEMVLELLRKDSNNSRQDLINNIAKNVKIVQRTLDSLKRKGYINKERKTRAVKWMICQLKSLTFRKIITVFVVIKYEF